MLKMMYKWTREFEDNRPEFEKMLSEYSEKLIVAKSEKKAIKEIMIYFKM